MSNTQNKAKRAEKAYRKARNAYVKGILVVAGSFGALVVVASLIS